MSANSDDDSQQRFALGFLFILIGLLLSTVIGATVYKTVWGGSDEASTLSAAGGSGAAGGVAGANPAVAPAVVMTQTTVTQTLTVPEGASVMVEGDVVKFYFATGSADIAPGAAEALAKVLQGVAAGRHAKVSGFHDTTGDRALNEALAKKRAESVRDVLLGLTVPADKVRLEKPAEMTGSGSNAEARRVEVILED